MPGDVGSGQPTPAACSLGLPDGRVRVRVRVRVRGRVSADVRVRGRVSPIQ